MHTQTDRNTYVLQQHGSKADVPVSDNVARARCERLSGQEFERALNDLISDRRLRRVKHPSAGACGKATKHRGGGGMSAFSMWGACEAWKPGERRDSKPLINPVLATKYGSRFARFIADAKPWDSLLGSFAACNISQSELRTWLDMGLLGVDYIPRPGNHSDGETHISVLVCMVSESGKPLGAVHEAPQSDESSDESSDENGGDWS